MREIATYIPPAVEVIRIIVLNPDGSILRTIVVDPKSAVIIEVIECA